MEYINLIRSLYMASHVIFPHEGYIAENARLRIIILNFTLNFLAIALP